MGASSKWIKSLVALKAAGHKGGRKWPRLWRSSSSAASRASAGEGGALASEASSASADSFSSVLAAVVRAAPRDFRLIRQEWAAVRIQTAFRAFLVAPESLLRLARRALKALRGIVRLQALVRGRLVRKQLAVTLKCMHALLRVQERAREQRARSTVDGNGSQVALNGRATSTKDAEEQWCDRQGSFDEVKSKLHMKHEGAAKRERAIAYAHFYQHRSSKHSGMPSSPATCVRSHESNRCNHNLSYLEGWMATKPWETRLMERNHTDSQFAKNCGDLNLAVSKHSDASSVKIRRNNVTTRVAAKPPSVLSASSSDFVYEESSPSTSSVTPVSATTTILASEARSDSGHVGGPNYMNLTKSAKARLNGCSSHRGSFQRQRSGDKPRVALSPIDTQSNARSEISVTSKRLSSLSLKGRSMTRSLDKENDDTLAP
ncbi:protein IQ-DOMAIN 1-like [Panicum miliaceum]|uniref:Protein IQ-DOMAIN 1-like n=1 Tax=Panicum miliaceum TaxID=4540 RepID=A0A3L6RFF3_PANMI|nr:protein IQ-DOMAIN 1-like [Panicum miliaceum]